MANFFWRAYLPIENTPNGKVHSIDPVDPWIPSRPKGDLWQNGRYNSEKDLVID